jgi:general secretion pathway protein N
VNRPRLALALLTLVLLIAFFPMRIALAGLGDNAVIGVRQVEGSVWNARLTGVTVGELVLGDFRASVSPWRLMMLRGYIDVASVNDASLRGTLIGSPWNWGFRDMNAQLALAGAFAPLPVESLGLSGTGIRFENERCVQTTGTVRLQLKGSINGVDLGTALSGPLRCDGKAVSALLVSGSAMERVALRLTPDGAYSARLNVRASDPAAGVRLSQAGFRDTPIGHEFAFSGRF